MMEKPLQDTKKSSIYIWGRGGDGQLGHGDYEDCPSPRLLSSLNSENILQLACGGKHNVAVSDSGHVWSWGWNWSGQLGHGDAKDRVEPAQVKPLSLIQALQKSKVIQVAAGADHTVALTDNGQVYSWGGDHEGQLGNNEGSIQFTPRMVVSLHSHRVIQVACGGGHTLALTDAGAIYSWGRGANGRLGHGDDRSSPLPKRIQIFTQPAINFAAQMLLSPLGLSPHVTRSRSSASFLGQPSPGGLSIQSSSNNNNNNSGSVPGPPPVNQNVTEVTGPVTVKSIACGWSHSMCITDDNRLFTWGKGQDGFLGHGDTLDYYRPNLVIALEGEKIIEASGGYYHTAVLTESGLYTCGWNEHGQLGLSTSEREIVAVPEKVKVLQNKSIKQVACGGFHTICVTHNGNVYLTGRLSGSETPSSNLNITTTPINTNNSITNNTNNNDDNNNSSSSNDNDSITSDNGIEDVNTNSNPPPDLSTLNISQSNPDSALFTLQLVEGLENIDYVCAGWWHTIAVANRPIKENPAPKDKSYPTGFGGLNESWAAVEALREAAESPQQRSNTSFLQKAFGSWMDTVNRHAARRQFRTIQANEKEWTDILKASSDATLNQPDPEAALASFWSEWKKTSRAKTLWRQEIPWHLRGPVWSQVIGNRLGITPKLFHLLEKRAKENRTIKRRNSYDGETDTWRLIAVDIPRTWAGFDFYSSSKEGRKGHGPFYNELAIVLESYALLRPDVGYVQGMTYIAGTLLLYMNTYEAFVSFANVLNCHFFLSLFKMDIDEILRHVQVFNLIFAHHQPDLFEHFYNIRITPEQFLFDWYMTIFAKTFPIPIASRIWDCFIMEGEQLIHRAAIGILCSQYSTLIKCNFEDAIRTIRSINLTEIDPARIIELTFSVTMPPYIGEVIQRIKEKDHSVGVRETW